MPPQLQFITLDVFTKTPYLGNPLAIIKVPSSITLSQNQKQLIAREFNLSEIVFLHERTAEDVERKDARIDIFTSLAEINFAGHPTIGTANYLLHTLGDQSVDALQTKAGRKTISKSSEGVNIRLAHNVHVHHSPFSDRPFWYHPVVSIVKGMTFILAELPSIEELGLQTGNLIGYERTYTSSGVLDEGWREGIVSTFYYVDLGIGSDGTRTLRTRMFGSREDPGTGSASSALCSYLSLGEREGCTQKYHLIQGVEMGRQCDIFVEVMLQEDSGGIESVILSGNATQVMEGALDVPVLDD